MPQLVPFYYINQVTFAFVIILIMLYIFSKYLLPKIVSLFIARISINKF